MENPFVEQCQNVADELGVELIDSYKDGNGNEVVEDDGILHVTKGNIRVAFDVSENQNLSASMQNRNTVSILAKLGMVVIGKRHLA